MKLLYQITLSTFILLLTCQGIYAQNEKQKKKLVQFSGVVMTADSLQPIFLTNIYVKHKTYRGTVSDMNGFFSFVVHTGDTILFSAIGYETNAAVIPGDLKGNTYSVIEFLKPDTVNLPEVVIYPWPEPHQLKEAILSMDLPDDDLKRAQRNLEREKMREIAAAMPMDGRENFNYQMREYSQKMYYNGQMPPMRIFDVFAWAEFFKALKRGDFKNKNKKK